MNVKRPLIFISWSGNASRGVAKALRRLIGESQQNTEPWLSDSVEPGANWRNQIKEKLEKALAGIIVVTAENQNAPWLLFESGALSKKNDRVYTVLFKMSEQLKDPLGMFQATPAEDKKRILKMVKDINQRMGRYVILERTLEFAFNKNWDQYEQDLKNIQESSVPEQGRPRSR